MFDVQPSPLRSWGAAHKGEVCMAPCQALARPRRVSPEAACLPRVGYFVRVASPRGVRCCPRAASVKLRMSIFTAAQRASRQPDAVPPPATPGLRPPRPAARVWSPSSLCTVSAALEVRFSMI